MALAFACNDAKQAAAAPVDHPPTRAHLKQLTGTVKVKRAAGDEWITAVDLMELYENDKVRTEASASALVEFSSGSFVTLGGDALIAIAETRLKPGQDRADVTVLKGRIDAQLDDADKKSLTVSTPAATVRAGREIVFQ